ncbi:MAG: helix-turn-helix domain-containing protein [Hyphomicrobiales bacterium]|nr:MAG: helix-turn-helix domain-containing protein [Hyphomicrobiales bacterium]
MFADLPYGKFNVKRFCQLALDSGAAGRDRRHMARTRIREFREQAEVSQEQLADAVGISVSQISRIERDEREPRLDEIMKISHRLGVAVAILIGEEDEPDPVPVVGRIGAGGSIDTSTEQFDLASPLYEIEPPFSLPDDALALEIYGESMWPRYDHGDVIIVSMHGSDIKSVIGFEAAVATEEGKRYLKRVIEGSRRGLFNLESHNAPAMRDVKVTWVSEVITVVRASQVRRIKDHARRKIQRQVRAAL